LVAVTEEKRSILRSKHIWDYTLKWILKETEFEKLDCIHPDQNGILWRALEKAILTLEALRDVGILNQPNDYQLLIKTSLIPLCRILF